MKAYPVPVQNNHPARFLKSRKCLTIFPSRGIMPPSAMKENNASIAAFHERRAGHGLEAARNARGKFAPEPRRGNFSRRCRVPALRAKEGGIPDAAEIGWYSVRLSRPMAFVMGVFS